MTVHTASPIDATAIDATAIDAPRSTPSRTYCGGSGW